MRELQLSRFLENVTEHPLSVTFSEEKGLTNSLSLTNGAIAVDKQCMDGCAFVILRRRVVDDGHTKSVIDPPIMGVIGCSTFIGQTWLPAGLWRMDLYRVAQFLLNYFHRIREGKTKRELTFVGCEASVIVG